MVIHRKFQLTEPFRTHILTPSEGVSVQINAYNFPVWGMLEKLSTSLLAGVPSIVKPSPFGLILRMPYFRI
jgi:oxepin-CoA hydrolase/3-oxo-5,6-dehydrosuberyl-CoA semialdehyde dehydrogenase